jgi:parallel beta-helix repeat protein
MNRKITTLRLLAVSVAMVAMMAVTPDALAKPKSVELPAGSVDALTAAIAQAGPGGTVVLESGLHSEVAEVVVPFPVYIIGEPGAILETPTLPANAYPITVTAGLHFKNAPGSTVRGVWLRPPGSSVGNCAVILENSPGSEVANNQMTQLQYGVFVQGSDEAVIRGNTISLSGDWQLAPTDPAYLVDSEGIISNSGQHVLIADNQISGGLFGVFASDAYGELRNNSVTGNFFGIFLCHNKDIGAPYYYQFSGSPQFGPQPATSWQVRNNAVHSNAWGLFVTDGSHDNVLLNNDASGNANPVFGSVPPGYDIELAGDTVRFTPNPPFAPACYNNTVIQHEDEKVVVKDCGNNNVVKGNVTLVDTAKDPCF